MNRLILFFGILLLPSLAFGQGRLGGSRFGDLALNCDVCLQLSGGTLTGDINLNVNKLTLDSDANSYIWSDVDDTIRFVTGSGTRLTITASIITISRPLNLSSQYIYSTTEAARYCGASGSTSHSLTSNDGFCAEEFEVDGPLYADSVLYVHGGSVKGASTNVKTITESVTFPGGGAASQATVGTILPDGAFVTGITSRVTTTGTTCAGMRIGVSGGGDDDQFGEDLPVSVNSTSDNTDWTAVISNPILADSELVVTGTNGSGTPANCVDLVVALTVHYIEATPATSN
jgi:hypothetical protein